MSFKDSSGRRPVSRGKVQQVIWVSLEDFAVICSRAAEENVAPNVYIASLLHEVLTGGVSGGKPERVVYEEKVYWACPGCWNRFPDLFNLQEHIKRSQECQEYIVNWVQKLRGK